MLMCVEGELIDFIEEFSDGRIQFGFLRVKDPNTSLLKFVLVAWVGLHYAFLLLCLPGHSVVKESQKEPKAILPVIFRRSPSFSRYAVQLLT
jgi:hypothetical protein